MEKKFEDGDGEVEVRFRLPQGIVKSNAKKLLAVDSQATSLVIKPKEGGGEALLSANPLYDRVRPGETSWYVDDGWIVVTLQKEKKLRWLALTDKEALDKRFPPVNAPARSKSAGKGAEDKDAAGALAERSKVDRLLKAAQSGDVDLFKAAASELNRGSGLAEAIADAKDANKRTSLHFAAMKGNSALCTYLTDELKLPVDPEDEDGETPLLHAARNGHAETCKIFLDRGSDPLKSSQKSGGSAIHYACGQDSLETVELLLDKGVDINVQSENGPPVLWAAGHGKKEVVAALLARGADPNLLSDEGIDALLSAVAAEEREIARLLVENGANVNVSATGGVTALHIAANHGDEPLVDLLLAGGANADAEDEDGAKPISAAAVEGHVRVIERLLPLTTPDPKLSAWTVDAILEHVEHPLADRTAAASGKSTEGTAPPGQPGGSAGVTQSVSPESKAKAQEAKKRGDMAFRKGDFPTALDAYTQAIDLDSTDGVFPSNRSLVWIRLGQAERALEDARTARALKPEWSKACYREGAALRLLERYEDAANAFFEGVQIDPENKELTDAFREAIEAGKKAHGVATQQPTDVKVTAM